MEEITTEEARRRLGLKTVHQIRKLIKQGKIKARQFGPARRGIWMVDADSVEAYKPFLRRRPAASLQSSTEPEEELPDALEED